MKSTFVFFSLVALLLVSYSCNKYADVSPTLGNVTFGFSKTECGVGSRIASTSTRASILFRIDQK